MNKRSFAAPALSIVCSLLLFLTGCPKTAANVTIGLSFADESPDGQANKVKLLRDLASRKGSTVIAMYAHHDAQLQNSQIEDLVAQGAQAVIVVAEDGAACVKAAVYAATAGVPCIAYERLIPSEALAAYVAFDDVEIGRQQASGVLKRKNKGRYVILGGGWTERDAQLVRRGQMEILLPVIQSEAVALVAEKQPARRDPADASRIMSGVLSAANGRVDAVVAFDDGIALGALKALKDRKLAGQAAVCGQGATAAACRAIVDGELTLTILKDDDELAAAAVDLAVKLALKEPVPGIVKNRLAVLTGDDGLKGEVPCYLVKGVIIDKNNVYDRIVKAGLQPYDEVYRDLPEKERPPRPKPSP